MDVPRRCTEAGVSEEASALRRKAGAGARWTSTSALTAAGLEFVQLAILARLLTPQDFGVYALLALVVGLGLSYTDLGLSAAIVQRQDLEPAHLSSMFWANLATGAALLGCASLLAPLAADLLAQPQIADLLPLAAFTLLVAPVSQQYAALLQKSLRFRALAVGDMLAVVAGAAVSLSLAATGHGVRSMVWGLLVNSVARAFALSLAGMAIWRPAPHFAASDLRSYAGFGVYQMGERTVNYAGFNLDRLLIGGLIDAYALGLYSVASQIVMKPIQTFGPVVARVMLPVFAIVQEDDARLRSGFLDGVRAIALVLFPLYAAIIPLAEPLVRLLLGERWTAAAPVLQFLALLGFFYSVGYPIGALLLAKGKVRIGFFLNLWIIVLYASAILAGAHWGVGGVAAALVVATAVGLFPIGFWVRWRLIGMRPAEYLMALAPALASATAMGVMVLILRDLLAPFDSAAAELAILLPAAVMFYLLLVVPSQRTFLGRLWAILR